MFKSVGTSRCIDVIKLSLNQSLLIKIHINIFWYKIMFYVNDFGNTWEIHAFIMSFSDLMLYICSNYIIYLLQYDYIFKAAWELL